MIDRKKIEPQTGMEIAVIGMAGRLPGAKNLHEYWDNLKNGVEAIFFFSDEELQKAGIDEETLKDPNYIKAYGHLQDKELFDASFFGYNPREAELMNPQIRTFHECAWEALEDAGYNPGTYSDRIGLYAGSTPDFQWEARSHLSGKSNEYGEFAAAQLTHIDFLCARVSYNLNLKGGTSFVQTGCSTSLAAIHQASRALLTGESEMVLAGGTSIFAVPRQGYLYREGMIFSQDGHCRVFAGNATGTIGGEGAGIVLLKRLKPALRDRDHIYAIIRGTAINNDGNRKVGFTAPSVEAQAEVIRMAQRMARVDPDTITYIEAHGTGTNLGDPVEIEALKLAFNTDKRNYCAIGSVKSNFGHLDAAAGVAGFIKTVLALKHKLILPSLHFQTHNPAIDFENSPFYVNTALKKWQSNGSPLRAGVSSFGIGGTNAHAVLEEALQPGVSSKGREPKILLFSAMTGTALDRATNNFLEYLKRHPGTNLADAAFTLQVGRKVFTHRRMVVCSDIEDAVDTLSTPHSRRIRTSFHPAGGHDRPVIFMFPGLGAQYVNMGRELYQQEPIFREEMDRCFEILKGHVDYKIKEILYPDPGGEGPRPDINHPGIAPLVIFIFEYALARLVIKWGITPQAMIGYSFGEYAAACTAGVFSIEDALKLVVTRGKLIMELPEGLMMNVPLSREMLEPLINHELSISIDNGPSCIVSGPPGAIEAFEKKMKEKRYMCMRLEQVSRAIHSRMMEPVLKKFEEKLSEIPLNKPQIPYISNVTGDWIKPGEAVDPGYWSRHLRETVQFARGIKKLIKEKNFIFIEVGPGSDMTALLNRYLDKDSNQKGINMVRHPGRKIADDYYLLNKIGGLWLNGVKIDWGAFYLQEERHRVSLPTYPFESQRYWIDLDRSSIDLHQLSKRDLPAKESDIADWFYIPTWKRGISSLALTSDDIISNKKCWLIFLDECGLGAALINRLNKKGYPVITVRKGGNFSKEPNDKYIINPFEKNDYDLLIKNLYEMKQFPGCIVHLWNLTSHIDVQYNVNFFRKCQYIGYYSLLFLAQSLVKYNFTKDMGDIIGLSDLIQIEIILNNVYQVANQEKICAEKATVLGLCKTIPQEYPNVICRNIDIDIHEEDLSEHSKLMDRLIAEFNTPPGDLTVAYRRNYRWVQCFEPIRLEYKAEQPKCLREKGVYLITGGLGEDSYIRSGYLSETFKARLVLIGRTKLPEREDWDQYMRLNGENDPVSVKIKRIKELEKLGAEVLVISADVADEHDMNLAVKKIDEKFGEINGVIHAAGITNIESSRLIMELGLDESEWHFRPKVFGLYALEKVLAGRELDFCLLTSSIASITAGLGLSAYTASSIFMDTFVQRHNAMSSVPWISLNWEGASPGDTIEAFKRVLSLDDISQLVVSKRDLYHQIRERIEPKYGPGKKNDSNKETISLYARPDLSNPYAPPGNNTEEMLVEIWQKLFAYGNIGIHDNFFELGGDSLKAINVLSKIHKKLNAAVPLRDFFNNPTIKELAGYIEKAVKAIFSPIKPVGKKEYYQLSSAQRRLYVLQQMDPGSLGYNEYHMVSFEGSLDRDTLQLTFNNLIERHEVLRTSIIMVNDEAVQQVHHRVEFEIENYDMKEVDEEAGTQHSAFSIQHSFMRPFDLAHPPFIRMGLIKQKENRHILMVDIHHIITDGLSFGIFVKELMAIYGRQVLPTPKLQYKDYSEWQNTREQQEIIKSQLEYWSKEFESEIPVLGLPTDYPRPPLQVFAGSSLNFETAAPEVKRLKDLAAVEDATLFMVLAAILNILLAKLSGQEDIIVGIPIAGRRHIELQNIMGFFVNTLALRNRPQGQKTFQRFLNEVKSNALRAFENQDYPFEELVEHVDVERDLSRNPLFDVMLLLENMGNPRVEIPGLKLVPIRHKSQIAKFDLELYAVEAGEKLLFTFQYCTKLFKQETIERFISYFKKIVTSILIDPGIKISGIEILTGEEKNRLLYDFNDTATGYPKDKAIHELFAEQVVKTPGSIAIGFEDQALTYSGLNEKVNQLANYLKKGINIGPEERVAVLVDRSMEMVTAILGILEAGGAYVPIDTSFPEARIKYMIDDAKIGVVISEKHQVKRLNRLQWECKNFHTFLCMDSASVYEEEEIEKNELMDEAMWRYIGESEDEIEAGGWASSYTGEPLSKEEMREYGDNTFKKLSPFLHKNMRVLEIGCASGITMFRIAPYVSFYYGTDLSGIIIDKNKNRVKAGNHKNITLDCLPAHDIDKIEAENFDLIIINSVIQYFHGHNYLRKVIAKAMDKLADKAYLFLGDIMDQELKHELTRETLEFKRTHGDKNYRTKTTWDAELFVSRGFLEDIALQTPGIQNIQFSNKIYTLENELTKFRYDALITVDKSGSKANKSRAPQKYQHDIKTLNTFSTKGAGFQKNQKVQPNRAAYVTYTSGTTGLPKGIMIEHRAVINFIKGMTDVIDFTEKDTILSLTTISFDIFGLETLLPLTRGTEVVIGNHDEQMDPEVLTHTLVKKEISILQLTPSRLQVLLSGGISRASSRRIKYLIVGGEAFPAVLLEEARDLFSGEIYNVYGPTETTIWSTIKNVTGERELNIGRPIANTRIYILDKSKKLLPVKVAGELFIGGDGLARGYLNKPELTAEKFISHMSYMSYMSYIYKTEDLARWLPDGNIEFLGRIDHQVKIRGFRIELGEIERQLLKHEDIKEAVVICSSDKDGDKYLSAYIITGAEPSPMELREYLLKYLPDYMIPSHFIRIEKIPLSTNGKIDRKALPRPGIKLDQNYAAPRNMIEKKLVGTWSEVLGIGKDQISINSNFFHLGGHSLKATILIARIHREQNAKIPLSEMFKNPTIESMAKYITETGKSRFADIQPAEKKEYYILSSAQKRMYIAHQMEIGSKSYNLPNIFRLIGTLDRDRLREACQELVRHHESFRTSFTMLEEKPIQQVHKNVPFEMDYYEAAEDKIPGIINRFIRPFDLGLAPLLRLELVRTGESEYILMVDMFHIISDAISSEMFLEDLITLYKGDRLTPLRVQYKDYSEWQNWFFASRAVKKEEEYWLDRFKGEIPVLNLPTDYPRSAIRSSEGSILFFDITRELTEKARMLMAETETTLYMVLLSVYNILLAKYTGQDEIIVGTPASGRNHADLQKIIGIFANMLAMKNHPTEDKVFSDFLEEIKENALKAYENQDYQFEELIDKLGIPMDPSRRPLFDVVLNMIKQGSEDYTDYSKIMDLTVTPYADFEYNFSKYDLLLRVTEEPGTIKMSLEYPITFKPETIENIKNHFIEILDQVSENKELKIKDITISYGDFLWVKNTAQEEDIEFNF